MTILRNRLDETNYFLKEGPGDFFKGLLKKRGISKGKDADSSGGYALSGDFLKYFRMYWVDVEPVLSNGDVDRLQETILEILSVIPPNWLNYPLKERDFMQAYKNGIFKPLLRKIRGLTEDHLLLAIDILLSYNKAPKSYLIKRG